MKKELAWLQRTKPSVLGPAVVQEVSGKMLPKKNRLPRSRGGTKAVGNKQSAGLMWCLVQGSNLPACQGIWKGRSERSWPTRSLGKVRTVAWREGTTASTPSRVLRHSGIFSFGSFPRAARSPPSPSVSWAACAGNQPAAACVSWWVCNSRQQWHGSDFTAAIPCLRSLPLPLPSWKEIS